MTTFAASLPRLESTTTQSPGFNFESTRVEIKDLPGIDKTDTGHTGRSGIGRKLAGRPVVIVTFAPELIALDDSFFEPFTCFGTDIVKRHLATVHGLTEILEVWSY